MSKIEQNKKKKEIAILEAAQQAFLGEGYTLASMDKIAKCAQVTKQTVYRYYPSKIELFEATLNYMAERAEFDFADCLTTLDTQAALQSFAIGFIKAHLCDAHLATYRLLVAESNKAPEIVNSFMETGSNDTQQQLAEFFQHKLKAKDPKRIARLWSSMLLTYRDGALFGLHQPTNDEIEEHAKACITFLYAALK